MPEAVVVVAVTAVLALTVVNSDLRERLATNVSPERGLLPRMHAGGLCRGTVLQNLSDSDVLQDSNMALVQLQRMPEKTLEGHR